jgi:Potential Queuosine, Q, salvage protein family
VLTTGKIDKTMSIATAKACPSSNPFWDSLRVVWADPTCVWVGGSNVVRVAKALAGEAFPMPNWREPVFPEPDEEFFDFVAAGNCINFAFTNFETGKSFTTEYRGSRWRGAFGMWACLRRALENGLAITSGEFLSALTSVKCQELFAGDPPMPMIEERCAILKEVGDVLCNEYQGRFQNLLASSRGKAFGSQGLVTQLLKRFPSFRDESRHIKTGTVLQFEKRAQLLAMMYQGRALASTVLEPLSDFRNLGPIADYSVPRALHAQGILRYAPKLERQIIARSILAKDSIAEQEIRAQATNAQIMLLNEINSLRRSELTFLELDYKLWMLGRGVQTPHHLTKTAAY